MLDFRSIAQNAFTQVPLFLQEQEAARQEEAAVNRQGDALTRLARMPALEEPRLFGDNRKADLNALIASAVAGIFDKSGQASKAIADGYVQGRLLDVDRQAKEQRNKRAQETLAIDSEIKSAGLTADLAGKKRTEARSERIRIEDRNARAVDKQRQDAVKAEIQAEVDLDRAQQRYNQASTFDEKMQAGKNLQRLQRGRGLDPITDEELAAAGAAVKSGRLDKAQKAARAVFENHVKTYGYVDEETAGEMESQIAALAQEWQVDRKSLPEVPTMASLAKEKQDFWKRDVDRRFKHLQETDRQKLAQGAARVAIAQQALKQAAERLQVSRDAVTISAYNAATERYRAELSAFKKEGLDTLETGSLNKDRKALEILKADLAAAIENDDDEKQVELRAKLGVLESEYEASQGKILEGFGFDPNFAQGFPLGAAGARDAAIAAAQAAQTQGPRPTVPAGPNVGGASSKMLQTKDGRQFSVQDAYEAAKRAIVANPAQKKAIIARYESLPGAGKWPG